jgi:hypothetical protein
MGKFLGVALAGLMAIGLCSGAQAANHMRIRGEIAATHGKTLDVTTYSGKKVDLTLGSRTKFVSVVPASLSDIKPGDFVGIGATGPKSRLTALEAVIFPASMRGTGEGHYPWSIPAKVANADRHRGVTVAAGAPPVRGTMTNGTVGPASSGSNAPPIKGSMTNGTVAGKVAKTGGRELNVSYKSGKVHIFVPARAPVVRLVVASRAIVKPREKAFVVATKSSGNHPLHADIVNIGKNGLMPPM